LNNEELDFLPAAGLVNSHLMTLAPLLIHRRFPRTDRRGSFVNLHLTVAPGNKVLIKLHKAAASASHRDSLVIVLHGLESSAEVGYVKGVCEKALHEGFSVARMNMRNCGGTAHLASTLYNAGMSGDVLSVAAQLCHEHGFKNVYLCGFSLGGNVVLKAAGEYGAINGGAELFKFVLAGVCAICPPIDLEGCVRQMEKGVNRIYEKNFVLSLKLRIYEKARRFPGRFDLAKLRAVRTVRGFDNAFTAPDAGFASAEEYYGKASSGEFLGKIDCPSMIIAAQDDPLVPFSCFTNMDKKGFRGRLLTPRSGGHVAFIHNKPLAMSGDAGAPSDPFWAEWAAVKFFKKLTTGGAVVTS
jgi:predicted alpha/beta-fold hydrolase